MKNRLERESLSPRRDLMQVTDKLFIQRHLVNESDTTALLKGPLKIIGRSENVSC